MPVYSLKGSLKFRTNLPSLSSSFTRKNQQPGDNSPWLTKGKRKVGKRRATGPVFSARGLKPFVEKSLQQASSPVTGRTYTRLSSIDM